MATLKLKYPIWYDRIYYITQGTFLIKQGDKTIYSGIAKNPDDTEPGANVSVRSILMNYLQPYFSWSDNGETTHPLTETANFQIWVGEETEARWDITVWYDWSYSYDVMNSLTYTGGIISRPVNYHWDMREKLIISFFESTDLNDWTYSYATSEGEETIELNMYNPTYYIGNVCIGPANASGITEFSISNDNVKVMEWKPEDERCGYGALTYVNKYGGWDTFLLEYPLIEKQDIDRQEWSTGTEYFNQSFDKQYITKSISTTYTTITGWLTDEQSEIIFDNLLNSPMIYLQKFDEETERFIPVYFTETSSTKKTFSNGRKLISYIFEMKESHTKLR